MKRSTVERLLQSKDYDDVILAVQLAYKLPIKEFEAIFDIESPVMIGTKDISMKAQYYYFVRNGKRYAMGRSAIVRSDKGNIDHIIDLTPEDYEKTTRENS